MIANYDIHDQAGYQQYLDAATPNCWPSSVAG